MKWLRDWRLWMAVLVLVFGAAFVWWTYERAQFDFVAHARQSLIAKGYRDEDLHVSSATITRTLWGNDQATIVFQVGIPPQGKLLTVGIRRSPFFGIKNEQ